MSDKELKELIASLAISQARTDEQLKKTDEGLKELKESQLKTDRQLKETDRKLDKVAKLVGSIFNNQGDVAEEYFYNSLKEKMKLLDMKFNDIGLNWRKSKKDLEDEFDIILTNGKNIALIEVKYKAHKRDVEKLDKKVKNFRKLFPEYSHLKLYAGIATFHIYKDAKELAKEKGYFVLKRNGNVIEEYVAENLKAA